MSSQIARNGSPQKRLLVLSGVLGDTRRYRTFHLYEQLLLAGLPVELSHQTDADLLHKAQTADIVFIHRAAWDKKLSRLFDLVESRGGLVIQDVDDLVFAPEAINWIDSPDFQDPVRLKLYQEDLRRFRQTLERCHAVLASTDYLAGWMRKLGKLAWVHRNAFSLEMLAQSESVLAAQPQLNQRGIDGKVVIGYASGTPTHNKDFALVKPAILKVMKRYPLVEMHLVGPLDPGAGWGEFSSRVRRKPLVSWRSLPSRLVGFDINIAPLVADNPFNQSKSEIKYMEAAMLSIPTLASLTDAFAYGIRHGHNGLLASSEAEWLEALSALIENSAERIAMGDRAYTDVINRYHPANRTIELLDSLNDICMSLQGRPFVERHYSEHEIRECAFHLHWESCAHERHPTMVEMAWYNLRQRGMKTLAGRVWVFFRRLLHPLFPFKSP
jgi:glycosyltransferase involved in cell wall biosynthesis